jgi:hypothetical protein
MYHDACHVNVDAHDIVPVKYGIKGEPVIGGVGGFHLDTL